MIIALLLVVRWALQHQIGWDLLMWAALVVGALSLWPVTSNPLRRQPVTWLWQAILVAIGIVQTGGPLRAPFRQTLRAHPRVAGEDAIAPAVTISDAADAEPEARHKPAQRTNNSP